MSETSYHQSRDTANRFAQVSKWFLALPWGVSTREHRVYLCLCAVYAMVGVAALTKFNSKLLPTLPGDFWIFLQGGGLMMSAVAALYTVHHLYVVRPESPIKSTWLSLRAHHLSDHNIPRIVLGFIGIALVMPMFVNLKSSIPLIMPYAYDQLFESWDRALHFGALPWDLLQPLTENYWVTMVLHRNYYFWFPVIYVTFYWQMATRQNPELRLQFITSFLACWILIGTLMAVGMSSVGPIFYDRVDVANPQTYAHASAFFDTINKESPLMMIYLRETLWASYQGELDSALIRGISAMPSMHVSLAMLLVLFGWRKHWGLGIAYSVFGLMILIGSVHLLWHYAIDGYVAIIATVIIWSTCGALSRKVLRQAAEPVNPVV